MTSGLSCATLSKMAFALRGSQPQSTVTGIAMRRMLLRRGPVFQLFGDKTGIRNENVGSIERLDLSIAYADLAHISFLASYDHEVANLDWTLVLPSRKATFEPRVSF